jgi:hypothetical protein
MARITLAYRFALDLNDRQATLAASLSDSPSTRRDGQQRTVHTTLGLGPILAPEMRASEMSLSRRVKTLYEAVNAFV